MIMNTIAALDEARTGLSDARNWLQSDSQPVDSPLPLRPLLLPQLKQPVLDDVL